MLSFIRGKDARPAYYGVPFQLLSLLALSLFRLIKVITASTANIVSRTILVKRCGCLEDGITYLGLNISSKLFFPSYLEKRSSIRILLRSSSTRRYFYLILFSLVSRDAFQDTGGISSFN